MKILIALLLVNSLNAFATSCEDEVRNHPIFKQIQGPALSDPRVQDFLLGRAPRVPAKVLALYGDNQAGKTTIFDKMREALDQQKKPYVTITLNLLLQSRNFHMTRLKDLELSTNDLRLTQSLQQSKAALFRLFEGAPRETDLEEIRAMAAELPRGTTLICDYKMADVNASDSPGMYPDLNFRESVMSNLIEISSAGFPREIRVATAIHPSFQFQKPAPPFMLRASMGGTDYSAALDLLRDELTENLGNRASRYVTVITDDPPPAPPFTVVNLDSMNLIESQLAFVWPLPPLRPW